MNKKKIKYLATKAAFSQLIKEQYEHKKVKEIRYEELMLQPYLECESFTEKYKVMLTALRSQCLRGIRKNFSKMYKSDLNCPLMCVNQNPQEDTQSHLITCKKLSNEKEININQIYGSVDEQLKVSKHCVKIMRKREKIMEETEEYQSLPTMGIVHGPGSRQQLQLGTTVILV